MKKLLLSVFALASFMAARADEGMWIPSLIGKNYDDMVRMGLKLTAEDLYAINHASMKDAIVQFNGGCTGEMISGTGLLLTNHHCGYEPIAALSTVEKNYLDNGFWAYSHDQELPAKGVSVLYLQHVDDVTAEINKAVGKAKGAKAAQKLEAARKKIEEREAQGGKYVANVRDYFNGNQYFVLIYKKYTDVRLVGTPPKSLGKFGGDTDNWMWPRHTADFSMFRVYAGKDNEPAEYSASNVPYQPKKYLPVSIKGVQEGDYAMIFGYPGRTNRYEVSYGVDLSIKETNPDIVTIRDLRLSIMRRHMDADKNVYLKQTASYARIANYWKYYIGQTEQLKRLKVVAKKQDQEQAYTKWAQVSDKETADLMSRFAKLYADYTPYAKQNVYYAECFKAPVVARLASMLDPVYKALDAENPNQDSIKKYMTPLVAARKAAMKDFDQGTEQELFAQMAKLYYKEIPKAQLPDIYQQVIFKNYGSDNQDKTFTDYADYVFNNTFLLDDAKFDAFVKAPGKEQIRKDAAAQYALSFVHNYTAFYEPKINAFADGKRALAKEYIRGLMKMKEGKLFYPDANSTMRITYGAVKSYRPQDGVKYDYFTTLDGLMDKYKPGSDEFDVPKDLIELYNKKDYGRYADADSSLHTCFITTDDITGGNSGSPVINANGELIGAAFDGNWEAMSGDIAFDKKYKRTIVCDIRFILFLIDKMGHAQNLIEEMDIHN
ncbi:S46 family peptidase [Chitinophagaceae bacterium MMS25-I14]